jgi:Zn-dependent M28 family amino/carboxypeptidase
VAVVNIEMIGRPHNAKGKAFITGSNRSNFYDLLNWRLRNFDEKTFGKRFFETDPYPGESLFERSDNYPFAKKGVPAHTIMVTGPNDQYYHSVNDETSTLNYSLMSKIIRAIAISTSGMVEGKDRPDRLSSISD